MLIVTLTRAACAYAPLAPNDMMRIGKTQLETRRNFAMNELMRGMIEHMANPRWYRASLDEDSHYEGAKSETSVQKGTKSGARQVVEYGGRSPAVFRSTTDRMPAYCPAAILLPADAASNAAMFP